MRRLAISSLFLSALVADPAAADVTAYYFARGAIGPSIIVEVADNGDARVSTSGETVAVRRDGITYLVRRDARGAFVLRLTEFRRIDAQVAPVEIADIPPAQVVEIGTEMVAGRQGIILDVIETPGRPPGNPEWGYVVSRDPDLAAIGPIVAEMFGGFFAPVPPRLAAAMREMQTRGTLVRLGPLLRLERISRDPIPADVFTLPGPELNGEEARARLGHAW